MKHKLLIPSYSFQARAPQVGNLSFHLYFDPFSVAQKEVEAFMKTTGVSVDKDSMKAFFKIMDGKDVPTLVRDGEKKKLS